MRFCGGNSWKSSSYISELLGLLLCLDSDLSRALLVWFSKWAYTTVYHPVLWSQVCNSVMAALSFWGVFHQHLRTVISYPNYLYSVFLGQLDLSKVSHISFES